MLVLCTCVHRVHSLACGAVCVYVVHSSGYGMCASVCVKCVSAYKWFMHGNNKWFMHSNKCIDRCFGNLVWESCLGILFGNLVWESCSITI